MEGRHIDTTASHRSLRTTEGPTPVISRVVSVFVSSDCDGAEGFNETGRPVNIDGIDPDDAAMKACAAPPDNTCRLATAGRMPIRFSEQESDSRHYVWCGQPLPNEPRASVT